MRPNDKIRVIGWGLSQAFTHCLGSMGWRAQQRFSGVLHRPAKQVSVDDFDPLKRQAWQDHFNSFNR